MNTETTANRISLSRLFAWTLFAVVGAILGLYLFAFFAPKAVMPESQRDELRFTQSMLDNPRLTPEKRAFYEKQLVEIKNNREKYEKIDAVVRQHTPDQRVLEARAAERAQTAENLREAAKIVEERGY